MTCPWCSGWTLWLRKPCSPFNLFHLIKKENSVWPALWEGRQAAGIWAKTAGNWFQVEQLAKSSVVKEHTHTHICKDTFKTHISIYTSRNLCMNSYTHTRVGERTNVSTHPKQNTNTPTYVASRVVHAQGHKCSTNACMYHAAKGIIIHSYTCMYSQIHSHQDLHIHNHIHTDLTRQWGCVFFIYFFELACMYGTHIFKNIAAAYIQWKELDWKQALDNNKWLLLSVITVIWYEK